MSSSNGSSKKEEEEKSKTDSNRVSLGSNDSADQEESSNELIEEYGSSVSQPSSTVCTPVGNSA